MDTNATVVRVLEAIGTPLAVSSRDGALLHEVLRQHLAEGRSVVLDFDGVRNITTAFLNASVGRLYGEFDPGVLRSCLRATNLRPGQGPLLAQVITRAQAFFSNDPSAVEAERSLVAS